MTKAFEQIMAGARDALAFANGERDGFVVHIPPEIDVKAIRQRLKLSQPKFAEAFGFSVGRVRDWEQGRFAVDAPSRVLLTVIDREPEAVMRALGRKPVRKMPAKKAKAA
jgi:putative transcriptional regulator